MSDYFRIAAVAFMTLYFTSFSVSLAEEAGDTATAPDPSVAEQIRGEWVLYRDTAEGRLMTIKEHFEDYTVVTTYDPNHKPLQSHRSEYRIDSSGSVPVFRYQNKVVLVGPNAGVKDEQESAYIFRIKGDRFFEIHGMLPDDKGEPSLIVWERLTKKPNACE